MKGKRELHHRCAEEIEDIGAESRIHNLQPIDLADRIDDWLYLPETLYAFMLLLVIAFGAGRYSVDSLIVFLFDHSVHTTGASH